MNTVGGILNLQLDNGWSSCADIWVYKSQPAKFGTPRTPPNIPSDLGHESSCGFTGLSQLHARYSMFSAFRVYGEVRGDIMSSIVNPS